MSDLKPVLIVENCAQGLRLNEESSNKSSKYLMEGVFTEFNTTNRNGRVYTAPKFLPHLNELLERKKTLGVLYGEFDHPDVFDTSLSRVSHVVENAWYDQANNRVNGQIVLLNTHWGKEAKAIVNEGYPVFVSSRAAGITDSAGHVELKKLFTYDCVADPGFASARMNLKSMNESLGIADKAVGVYEADDKTINRIESKFSKIFDLSDETKTNDLFNMNKNDNVTKNQLTQYSNYLVGEIKQVKEALNTITSDKKKFDPAKIEQVASYYESLNTQFEKVVKYLDYLAEKVQVAVDGHKEVKEVTEKLVKHSDYMAENLEKTINYTEYLAENLDKNISYAEYLAENLDKNISYAEYIAENLDKNISYAEYLAENLDKNISYSEYIAENVSDGIKYSEYIAENLDTSIAFQEYLAENVEKSIKYSEYVAECTDNTLSYAGMIAEKLNGNSAMINENMSVKSPHEFLKGGMAEIAEDGGEALQVGENEGYVAGEKAGKKKAKEEEEEVEIPVPAEAEKKDAAPAEKKEEKPAEEKKEAEPAAEKKEEKPAEEKKEEKVEEAVESTEVVEAEKVEETVAETKVEENAETVEETVAETTETEAVVENENVEPVKVAGDLTKKIDMLIEEAKKREASKVQEPHFYKFLNKSQISAFESLSDEEKEEIKVAMNESTYYTSQDVLKKMREVLNSRQVSPEEKLVEGVPSEIKPIWESLNESDKKSVLAQSKFYLLDSEEKIEHFWRTRKFKAVGAINESKKLISEDTLKMNEGLSEGQTNAFLEKLNSLK